MTVPISLLMVEDSPDDAELLLFEVENGGYDVTSVRIDSADAMKSALETAEWDLILSDYRMPDFSGLEALALLRNTNLDIPFILVSGTIGEETAAEAMRAGASDYIMKGNLTRLVPAIKRELREAKERRARRKADEDLREASYQWQSTFDAMREAVFLLDPENRILRSNRAAAELTGWSVRKMTGMRCWEAIHGALGPIEGCPHSRMLITGKRETTTLTVGDRVFEVTVDPVRDGSGRLAGAVHIMADISKAKQAEREREAMRQQLVQSQKLESIGTLAGGVAHEINNPINAVMNYAQLIEDDVGRDSKLATYAEEIIKECERVAAITKDLLSFARLDKDESYHAVQIADVVSSAVALYKASARRDRIVLETKIPEGLPAVLCRGQQVQQVVLNLLTNARDALNEKYESNDPGKKAILSVGIRDRDGKRCVRITVEDHGNGIPENARERLFDPFFTTKPEGKGTGLGLSISHGIVREHGGEIHVESEPGKWTRFHVDLPQAEVSCSSGSAWKAT